MHMARWEEDQDSGHFLVVLLAELLSFHVTGKTVHCSHNMTTTGIFQLKSGFNVRPSHQQKETSKLNFL